MIHAGANQLDSKEPRNNFVSLYTKAAEEADELARGHRSMVK
jgi:hypothetical protein